MSGIATGTALLIGLGVTAAATVGTSIYEAVNKPAAPKAPTQSQQAQEQAQAAQAAAQAQATALTKQRGMASTVLTSPTGASGTPPTQRATLGA
jgi:membrane protease subunit (stomatin/prohibitin family)